MKGFSEGIGQYGISRSARDVNMASDSSSTSTSTSTSGREKKTYPLHCPQPGSTKPCPVGGWSLLPMKDRLVVLTKLGQGASSIVYKAFDISRMILVALKTVPIFDRDKRHQMVRELNTLYNLLREKEVTRRNLLGVSGGERTNSSVERGTASVVDASDQPARGNIGGILDFYDAFR